MASWTAKTAPILVLVALALPASASGQATRTWVSGVGDDLNPCSRTAPCKTWAGAISKTASGGEINALDPGGYGAVTITKPITIDGGKTFASILSSSTNGIVVNLPTSGANDRVAIRNLSINGGTPASPGLNGIRILRARSVKVVKTKIFNFSQSGIHFQPSGSNSRLFVHHSSIHDNKAAGVMVAPVSGGGGRASIRYSEIDENGCGVVAATFGAPLGANPATNCATATSTSGIAVPASASAYHNSLTDNEHSGVFSHGNQSVIRIADNEIFGSTNGLNSVNGGAILSWGNNFVSGNSTDGSPTGPVIAPK